MKSVEYIIVGFGLAGMAFAEQLRQQHKSFVVINDQSQQSSRVAGGLYNPVILKRFTMAWDAPRQLENALSFYETVERFLNATFKSSLPVLRSFNSIEEQNLWAQALDKPNLSLFLSDQFIKNTNDALDVPYQFGLVKQTGRVAIKRLLDQYLMVLERQDALQKASFEHHELTVHVDHVQYKAIKAKHIVFCEGFGMLSNPYFAYLPMVGNKGEYLIIEAPDLQLSAAVKSAIFILPLGENRYKVGATYSNQDTTPEITLSARAQITKKLEQVLKVPYKIINQEAGIRPTVKDRKPLIGTHPKYQNIHLMNGLGSRGILVAPSVSKQLYAYIENDSALDPQIDLRRFSESL